MNWRVFAASAIGKHHVDHGLPCQDAFAFRKVDALLICVVCDGAGSARHSELGAAECVRVIVERLEARLKDSCTSDVLACTHENIEADIGTARHRLEDLARERQLELRDLACTVVGAIIGSEGGYFFHIGDGLAIVEVPDNAATISAPQNGEYANETYFITADDWHARLRISAVPAGVNCLALMSDGAMPFVMNRAHTEFVAPFINPVRTYLLSVGEQEGSEALHATLDDEKTWAITGDDKTLLLALAV